MAGCLFFTSTNRIGFVKLTAQSPSFTEVAGFTGGGVGGGGKGFGVAADGRRGASARSSLEAPVAPSFST